MPTSAMLFALLAGAAAATWTICLKLGSTKVNAAFGAMVIAGVACVVNALVMLTMRARGHEISLQPEGLWLVAAAGAAAAGVDLFALLAYERGLRLTSSLVIGSTSTALVLFVGFVLLREPLTARRSVALVLVVIGSLLLQVDRR